MEVLVRRIFFLLLLGVSLKGAPAPLLLISMDAFRWDYCDLHPNETPHLRALRESGASAKALIPVYPSNTFPNHYTIVTGLWPAHHGMINNNMFDPTLGLFFHNNQVAATHDSRWWGGEPIWVTAEKQGYASACSFWPGSEAEVGGHQPTYWKTYDYSVPFEKRLDELVGWLKAPAEKRPLVAAFYLEETNSQGHTFGPDSPELLAAIQLLDTRLGVILDRLKGEGITVNLVIVSDHGMTDVSLDRVVVLDDYLEMSQVQLDFDGPEAGLRPVGNATVDSIMAALAKLPPQVKAYRAEDLPERFHLKNNPRIPPIWIAAEQGWGIYRNSYLNTVRSHFHRGEHGYDPALESMRGILIVNGPAFKSGGVSIAPVENIHLYNLLCGALRLKPAPNDGDDRLVKALLKAK